MIKNIIWTVVFVFVAATLESTLLGRLALYGAVPDIALGILVYVAYANGIMTGQLCGFFSGLTLDLVSASPIGLNALVRTLIGALAGLIRGRVILDYFLVPAILCAVATMAKAVVLLPLSLVFEGVPSFRFSEPLFWAELALNTLSAAPLFALLRCFNSLLVGKEVR